MSQCHGEAAGLGSRVPETRDCTNFTDKENESWIHNVRKIPLILFKYTLVVSGNLVMQG